MFYHAERIEAAATSNVAGGKNAEKPPDRKTG
jgi:hypothetical protein